MLESKLELFSENDEADLNFKKTIIDYLDFYDTKLKNELIDFA